MKTEPSCPHTKKLTAIVEPKGYVCEICIEHGGTWMHLRTCQTCGATLCCDSSPSRHMTAHYHQTEHPLVISAEPGENWLWCYDDQLFTDY